MYVFVVCVCVCVLVSQWEWGYQTVRYPIPPRPLPALCPLHVTPNGTMVLVPLDDDPHLLHWLTSHIFGHGRPRHFYFLLKQSFVHATTGTIGSLLAVGLWPDEGHFGRSWQYEGHSGQMRICVGQMRIFDEGHSLAR